MIFIIKNKFISYLFVYLLGCLCLLAQAEAAYKMKHNKKIADNHSICSDPQQPATLRCAPAPSSQFDSKGKLWIVWSYAGHIYVTSSDNKGKTLNQSVVVNRIPEAISARGENRPKIVVDKKGKIYVSWTTPLAKKYTGNVRFSYSEDGGNNFTDPIIENDNLDITGHRFESLAVNNQGTIFMAWLDKRDRYKAKKAGEKYHGAALYYSYSTDGGKTFRKNINVMAHSCECCKVVMDIDNDQLPAIVWRNIYAINTRDHSIVKLIDNETPGKPIRLSYDNWKVDGCPHHGPAISISDSDIESKSNYHLVWFNNGLKRHGLFYSRIEDPNKDKAIETQLKENTNTLSFGDYSKGASHPDVLSLDNKVWIVWKEFDGVQESIRLQFSNNYGKTFGQANTIFQTRNGSDNPFLINDKGVVYLQWQTKQEGYKLLPVNLK